MRIFASSGLRGQIIDLDTSQLVPKVIWFDIEAGMISAYHPDGRKYLARGRFKFIPAVRQEAKIILGAPKCAKCASPLTLPGDDLCPACRAKERGQKNQMTVEKLTSVLLDHKCGNCSRLAVWSVSDEVEATPAPCGYRVEYRLGRRMVVPDPTRKGYYERGATVGRRYYCERCYKPCRILDSKGEIIKEIEPT